MSANRENIRYLVFDIESVADPHLVAQVRYPDGAVSPTAAVRFYRDELMEKKGSDFIPCTFQFPISLTLAKVRDDFSLAGMSVLKFEDGGPGQITQKFWDGWVFYGHPTLVTFNGRSFDLPLMELTALRYGIPIPAWFALGAKSFEQPRNRYNVGAHLDLCDLLTNSGAIPFTGGLNLAAKMLRKPGKIDTAGDMVQDMFDARRFDEIHDYCRCDVLDTYFLFLRVMRVMGRLAPQDESKLTDQSRTWLEKESVAFPIFRRYLDGWDANESRPTLDQYCREMESSAPPQKKDT